MIDGKSYELTPAEAHKYQLDALNLDMDQMEAHRFGDAVSDVQSGMQGIQQAAHEGQVDSFIAGGGAALETLQGATDAGFAALKGTTPEKSPLHEIADYYEKGREKFDSIVKPEVVRDDPSDNSSMHVFHDTAKTARDIKDEFGPVLPKEAKDALDTTSRMFDGAGQAVDGGGHIREASQLHAQIAAEEKSALGQAQHHLDHVQELRDQADAGAAREQSRIDDLLRDAGKPWCEDGQWDGPTDGSPSRQQPTDRQDLTDEGNDGSTTLASEAGGAGNDGSNSGSGFNGGWGDLAAVGPSASWADTGAAQVTGFAYNNSLVTAGDASGGAYGLVGTTLPGSGASLTSGPQFAMDESAPRTERPRTWLAKRARATKPRRASCSRLASHRAPALHLPEPTDRRR